MDLATSVDCIVRFVLCSLTGTVLKRWKQATLQLHVAPRSHEYHRVTNVNMIRLDIRLESPVSPISVATGADPAAAHPRQPNLGTANRGGCGPVRHGGMGKTTVNLLQTPLGYPWLQSGS